MPASSAASSRKRTESGVGLAGYLAADPVPAYAQRLAATGVLVRATDQAALEDALALAGLAAEPAGGGGLLVDAPAEQVGRIALDAHVVLTELRAADGAGLEQLFFSLTGGDAA